MTAFDEALKELGVEAAVSDDDLRRAYLRRIKVAKPEVDPEGFQRARAAYQNLQEHRASLQVDQPAVSPPSEAVASPSEIDPAEARPAADVSAPDAAVGDPIVDLLDRSQWEPAAHLLTERYDQASEGASVRLPHASRLFLLILRLQETGALDASDALGRAFYRWVTVTGRELEVLGGGMAPYWAIIREIGTLPRKVPQVLRSAIAVAAQRQNLADAAVEMNEYRRDNTRDARALAAYMRARTPILAHDLAAVLDPPSVVGKYAVRFIFPVFAVVSLITRASTPPPPPVTHMPVITSTPIPALHSARFLPDGGVER